MAHPKCEVSIVVYESLVARFVTPVIKRHEARAIQASDALWRAWFQRKQEAEDQGLHFDEPPPGSGTRPAANTKP